MEVYLEPDVSKSEKTALEIASQIEAKSVVEKVKYASHTTDHIPISEVIEFSNN